MIKRCSWVEGKEEIYLRYHDEEWGIAKYDDDILFEMLVLESFQAGLSWITILKKRKSFKTAFDDFNLDKIINYDDDKVRQLLENEKILDDVNDEKLKKYTKHEKYSNIVTTKDLNRINTLDEKALKHFDNLLSSLPEDIVEDSFTELTQLAEFITDENFDFADGLWTPVTWRGKQNIDGQNVWGIGDNIYYADYDAGVMYKLNKVN